MSESLHVPVELCTARLRLRKPELEDASPLFAAYTTDPEVVRFLSWQVHERLPDTLDFLRQCLETWSKGTNFAYVIELRDEPASPMGMIDLRPQGPRVAFGYVLARDRWGHGYMSEALSSLVNWALAQPHIWRASAYCDADNSASARVMQKAGMEFEGVLRRYEVFPNVSSEPRDCLMYAKARP